MSVASVVMLVPAGVQGLWIWGVQSWWRMAMVGWLAYSTWCQGSRTRELAAMKRGIGVVSSWLGLDRGAGREGCARMESEKGMAASFVVAPFIVEPTAVYSVKYEVNTSGLVATTAFLTGGVCAHPPPASCRFPRSGLPSCSAPARAALPPAQRRCFPPVKTGT